MPSTSDNQADSSGNAAKSGQKAIPTRWWQWVLLYPAFAMAILTAAPDWFDRIERLTKQTFQSEYVEETELVAFMKENPECVASPVAWVEATNQTKVDGTICSVTGDVWLRILGANGVAAYKGIDISDLLEEIDRLAAFPGFSTAARAATVPGAIPATPATSDHAPLRMSQLAVVVCQQFSGSRIIRHLRAGNICYDETVNSRNGVVISKKQVPCKSSCSPN